MSKYRMFSVDDGRIVTAFIEHSHVDSENVGYINRAAHASLIRTDGHQMVCVDLKTGIVAEDILDELIGWCHGLKSGKRDCVLDTRIMRVERYDVVNTECHKLLQYVGTVKGLTSVTDLLTPFIEIGHDDIDTMRFSTGSGNNTFQVLIMIVRRHDVLKSGDIIGDIVVTDINENVQIGSSPEPKRGVDAEMINESRT